MTNPMIVTTGPDLSSVLAVVDSCGGARATDKSEEWNAGYDAALASVERELKRSWGMLR
jgi:hypothetical protein